jgi:hypothetical protein
MNLAPSCRRTSNAGSLACPDRLCLFLGSAVPHPTYDPSAEVVAAGANGDGKGHDEAVEAVEEAAEAAAEAGEAAAEAAADAAEAAAEAVEAQEDDGDSGIVCRRVTYYDDFGRQRSRRSCGPR